MDEPLPTNKKAPHLSEDEVTLYLIASGLTLLAQEIDNGTPLTLPPASFQNQSNSASLMLRLMLCHDEIFRLPAASRGLQVVSELAWLTVAGEDIFLKSGEKLGLLTGKEIALVSALGRAPLILEVLGDNTSTAKVNVWRSVADHLRRSLSK